MEGGGSTAHASGVGPLELGEGAAGAPLAPEVAPVGRRPRPGPLCGCGGLLPGRERAGSGVGYSSSWRVPLPAAVGVSASSGCVWGKRELRKVRVHDIWAFLCFGGDPAQLSEHLGSP